MSTQVTEFDLILTALRAVTPTKGTVTDDKTLTSVVLSNVGRFNSAEGTLCVNITYGKVFALHRVFVDSFGNLHLSKHAIPNTNLVIVSAVPSDIECVNVTSANGYINSNLGNYANYDCRKVGSIDLVVSI